MEPIDYFPQVKELVMGYVLGLRYRTQEEDSSIYDYCKDLKNCLVKFGHAVNFVHYKYPNGDSKFEFDATFDVIFAEEGTFTCKYFKVILHNLCGNCPNNPIQFLNENDIYCNKWYIPKNPKLKLIEDINGPDGKKILLATSYKMLDWTLLKRMYPDPCQFEVERGRFFSYKQKRFGYMYKFDTKVKITCDKMGGYNMDCFDFIMTGYFNGTVSHTDDPVKCNNYPNIGPNWGKLCQFLPQCIEVNATSLA